MRLETAAGSPGRAPDTKEASGWHEPRRLGAGTTALRGKKLVYAYGAVSWYWFAHTPPRSSPVLGILWALRPHLTGDHRCCHACSSKPCCVVSSSSSMAITAIARPTSQSPTCTQLGPKSDRCAHPSERHCTRLSHIWRIPPPPSQCVISTHISYHV